jgi:carboxymethylenebutenolidase
MALRSYLREEIAHDYADGLLTRRDALRRLGLLGLGLTSASALLAACGGDDDDDGASATTRASTSSPTGASSSPSSPTTVAASLTAEPITFAGPNGELTAAYAAPSDPKGAVLVVHENRGLTPHFYDVVGRLADAGYAALAVDLVSEEGGTASMDEGAVQGALGGAPEGRLIGDLQAGIDELQARAPGVKVGAVGFCFGGAMVWNLLNAGEDRIAAAVPFYGPGPANPDFSGADAAVLAVYGELDSRVNASQAAMSQALEAAGLEHEIKVYPGADHAFFNDTGERYNEAAATDAYDRLLAWFDQYLG